MAAVVLVVAGATLFVVALATLSYLRPDHCGQGCGYRVGVLIGGRLPGIGRLEKEPTLWALSARATYATVLTGIAAAVAALAILSLWTDSVVCRFLLVACSLFLLGETFPLAYSSGDYATYGAGFWVATGAAGGIALGALARGLSPARRSQSVC